MTDFEKAIEEVKADMLPYESWEKLTGETSFAYAASSEVCTTIMPRAYIAIPFINRLLDYNHGLFSRYKKNGNQLP